MLFISCNWKRGRVKTLFELWSHSEKKGKERKDMQSSKSLHLSISSSIRNTVGDFLGYILPSTYTLFRNRSFLHDEMKYKNKITYIYGFSYSKNIGSFVRRFARSFLYKA